MTAARMKQIWERVGGVCWMCGEVTPMRGAGVRYDHKLPLEPGGSDEDEQIFPLHTEPCDRIKTAADRQRIDKARRQSREKGPQREGRVKPKINSRPFPKGVKRPWPKRGFR
jgi:hypothetical protein